MLQEQDIRPTLSREQVVEKGPTQMAGRLFAEASQRYSASVNAQAAYIVREHRTREIPYTLWDLMIAGGDNEELMTKLANMANVAHRQAAQAAEADAYVHLNAENVAPVFRYCFSKAMTLSELETPDLDFIMDDMYPRYREMPLHNGSTDRRERKYWREIKRLMWRRRLEYLRDSMYQQMDNVWGRRL